eukprot:GHVS01085471.1.p1 GENE.GHVS01085471.1~~GHVS01085471.1.p1  ORF type:complete len:109 (+),score=12.28 GHVS01085471.1:86-412(+)
MASLRGLSRSWCVSADTGLVAPDVVIYLDLPPQKALERSEYGEEIYEKVSIQGKVYSAYEQFSSLPYWTSFDASLNEQDLSDMIFAKISNLLSGSDASVLRGRLWNSN